MRPLKVREKYGPERLIQDAIIKMLRNKEWFVKVTHGDAYNFGWPDLFCCHRRYGQRWVEVKLPDMKGSKFTSAQSETFPLFTANGSGVWILTGDTEDEYAKLFKACNWAMYLLK
jgi:hypothetical protein